MPAAETTLGSVAEAAALAAAPAIALVAPAAAPAAAAQPAPAALAVAELKPMGVSAQQALEGLVTAFPGMKAGLEPLIAKVKDGCDAAAFNMALLGAVASGQKLEMDVKPADNALPPVKAPAAEAKIDTAGIYAGRAAAVAQK